jgi:hypothetical protein
LPILLAGSPPAASPQQWRRFPSSERIFLILPAKRKNEDEVEKIKKKLEKYRKNMPIFMGTYSS